MEELHRAIGRLEGKVDAQASDINEIKSDAKEIKKEIKTLQQFKWRIAGGAAMLSAIVATLIEFFRH